MSSNLFKETSAAARALDIELRGILEELDPEAGKPLLERLTVDAHPTPLLVFTGYHSAGKSTLIEALTNRAFNIPIGSGVTTAEVTEYVWDGDVRLVDTPGVHADRPEHDELAERALQAADLVLFAVPVELFDDILVDHLRDVLGRLAKARQTLIVITKAGTMDAAPGHREAAIKEALGSFESIPWVECDAQYYLDGLALAETAPEDAAAFITASGMDAVAAHINSFASQQGELGTLSQPFQLINAIALEAIASLTEDPNEHAALTVLARQRSALTKKRVHLEELFNSHSARFRSSAIQAATQFADKIEGDEQRGGLTEAMIADHTSALNVRLSSALEDLETSVTGMLETQFDDLASEILAIEATPSGRLAVQLGELQTANFEGSDVQVTPGRLPEIAPPTWAKNLPEHLKQFNQVWGAGNGVKAAAGSNGHKVVLKVGHAFGKKFRPWEATKVANNIGKAAKVGGTVIAIGLEAYAVFAEERAAVNEERARVERRRKITQEILAQADSIVADAFQTVRSDLDSIFKPEFERIDALANEIRGTQSTRTDLRDRLDTVRQQATHALEALGKSGSKTL